MSGNEIKAVLIGGPADMHVVDIESHCPTLSLAERVPQPGRMNARGLIEYETAPLVLHVYRRLALQRGTIEFVGFYHACNESNPRSSSCGYATINSEHLSRRTIRKAVTTLCNEITKACYEQRNAQQRGAQ